MKHARFGKPGLEKKERFVIPQQFFNEKLSCESIFCFQVFSSSILAFFLCSSSSVTKYSICVQCRLQAYLEGTTTAARSRRAFFRYCLFLATVRLSHNSLCHSKFLKLSFLAQRSARRTLISTPRLTLLMSIPSGHLASCCLRARLVKYRRATNNRFTTRNGNCHVRFLKM